MTTATTKPDGVVMKGLGRDRAAVTERRTRKTAPDGHGTSNWNGQDRSALAAQANVPNQVVKA